MRLKYLSMDNAAYILTHFRKKYINVYRMIIVGQKTAVIQ